MVSSSDVEMEMNETESSHAFGVRIPDCVISERWKTQLRLEFTRKLWPNLLNVGVYQDIQDELVIWIRVPSTITEERLFELMSMWTDILRQVGLLQEEATEKATPTIH